MRKENVATVRYNVYNMSLPDTKSTKFTTFTKNGMTIKINK